jgi:hypothetical protein
MINIKVCKICTKEFTPTPGSKGVYCSRTCQHSDQGNISRAIADKKREVIVNQYVTSPAKCLTCSVALPFEKRKYKFCSRSCSIAHSNKTRLRTISPEFVERQRAAALANPTGWTKSRIGGKPNRAPREIRVCATCNNSFEAVKSNPRVSCSKACAMIGGIREGSGRAKTGYYKGIYCGSTYELAFLIYHLDKGHPIQRCVRSFPYKWENKDHLYYPDFEINGIIYEIKGRMQPVDLVKIASCNAQLISKDDIKPYIQYVSSTYQVAKDNLWLLYEEKSRKQCDCCGNPFVPKTKKVRYCSYTCSAKARH